MSGRWPGWSAVATGTGALACHLATFFADIPFCGTKNLTLPRTLLSLSHVTLWGRAPLNASLLAAG